MSAATASATVRRPIIPLFGALNQVERCVQVLLTQIKKGHLNFNFALEAEDFKVSYAQKGVKRRRRPKTVNPHHPREEHHDEEHLDDEDHEWMDETSGRGSPTPSTPLDPPPMDPPPPPPPQPNTAGIENLVFTPTPGIASGIRTSVLVGPRTPTPSKGTLKTPTPSKVTPKTGIIHKARSTCMQNFGLLA